MRVSLFSSLSLVNVWLLNDGLFVECFHQMQSLKPFHHTNIWYSVSLLSLAYFFFLSTSLLANLDTFLFLRDSLVLLLFFIFLNIFDHCSEVYQICV